VLNRQYTLPGIGSYVAAAIQAKDFAAIAWAIATMIFLIVLIDQFFWKPLVTVADRYKLELSAGEERRFWLVDLWRSASLPRYLNALVSPVFERLDRALSVATAVCAKKPRGKSSKRFDLIYNSVLILIAAGLVIAAAHFVLSEVGISEVGHAALLGLATAARVLVLLIFSTVVGHQSL